MRIIEIKARDAHALLEVATRRQKTAAQEDFNVPALDYIRFEFVAATDPRIPIIQKLFNRLRGSENDNSQALPTLEIEKQDSSETWMTVEQTDPIMAPLRDIAGQYLNRKVFRPASKDGKLVFRMALPPWEILLPYRTEDAVPEAQRMITSCNILDLRHVASYSEAIGGMALKFNESAVVEAIKNIAKDEPIIKRKDLLAMNSPYRVRVG